MSRLLEAEEKNTLTFQGSKICGRIIGESVDNIEDFVIVRLWVEHLALWDEL